MAGNNRCAQRGRMSSSGAFSVTKADPKSCGKWSSRCFHPQRQVVRGRAGRPRTAIKPYVTSSVSTASWTGRGQPQPR